MPCPVRALVWSLWLAVVVLAGACEGASDAPVDAGPAPDTPVATPADARTDSVDDGGAADVPAADVPTPAPLCLNHIQVKGTHNSYHLSMGPEAPTHRAYEHAPLDVQLESQGVRQFELDLHWNDDAQRFDVFHEVDDTKSTCDTFADCLGVLRAWSDDHPAHHTIFVALECKNRDLAEVPADYFERLDAEIRAVWPDERLVRPDDVRGEHASPRDAVETVGWPTVDATRGRALFILLSGGVHWDHYTNDGATLDGRVMFVRAHEDSPLAVVAFHDDPLGQTNRDEIAALARAGYLIRTRSDASVLEPTLGVTARRDDALVAGAHLISTDFPAPETGVSLGIDYWVEIPGGTPSRCNPITAPPDCTAARIEDLP